MRLRDLLALAAVLLLLTGCRSAFIDATISNRTSAAIPLIEVEYPSASFGTENLASGKDFHYRFKVLGDGPVKVIYTDSTHQEKRSSGPALREGDQGSLVILFAADGVHWQGDPAKH